MPPGDDFYFFWLRHIPTSVAVIAAAFAFWQWRRRRRRRLDAKLSLPPRRKMPLAPRQTSARLAAKIDFLERVGGRYGYANSEKGFIDDWRSFEFPTLVPPLKLPRRFHPQKRQSPESSTSQNHFNDAKAFWDNESSEPEVYLDYAGSAIPTRTLRSRVSEYCQILANPHSQGGGIASDRTLQLMQLSKDRTLQHFGVQHEATFGGGGLEKEEENEVERKDNRVAAPCPGYQLVFTSGATESLRLVSERFPWSSLKVTADPKSCITWNDKHQSSKDSIRSPKRLNSVKAQSILLFPRNVHTSVIGMRQIALQRGAQFHCVSAEDLLDATSEWFRELTSGSMSYDCREPKRHAGDKEEEKKSDHALSISEDTRADSTPYETMWVHHLLVLPLECNFGGDRFDWSNTTAVAQELYVPSYLQCTSDGGEPSTTIRICHKWHILLDAAKAAATSPVNLPALAPHAGGPDFAVISFYKMSGAPTGLGALFVKKHPRKKLSGKRTSGERCSTNESKATQAASYMKTCSRSKITQHCGGIAVERSIPPRQFFGGGSVDVVLAQKDFMIPRNSGAPNSISNDEDENIDLGVMVHGTEHFRGIASLSQGFRELDELGGMDAISSHSTCLAVELVHRLGGLVHDNGKPVVHIYGRWNSFVNDKSVPHPFSGPTVAFNIFDRDGSPIGYDEVSRLATFNRPPIQLRTGCFCNPGACQDALPLTDAAVLANFASGHVCGDRRGIVNGKPTGALRASFGKDSLWEDMDALVSFIDKVFLSRGKAIEASHSSDESSNATVKIDSLFVYPIKSCAAMRVNGGWPIDRQTGRLAFDREFALVDASGSAMRLHSYPKMSAIRCSAIDLNAKKLTVTAPNHEDLILSLEDPNQSVDHTMSPEDIQVCGALCKGNICADTAGWFSSVLGVRCWLARHYADPSEKGPNGRYAYCNEAPLLVVSQRSISFLNSVTTSQGWGLVEPRHFRPNIVVSSICEASDEKQKPTNPEDSWQQINVKKGSTDIVELKAVGKCARCQMVDIDPSSGMKGNTLRALAQYRRTRGQINFGTFFTGNIDSSEGNGWLEEGNEVHVSSITSKGDP